MTLAGNHSTSTNSGHQRSTNNFSLHLVNTQLNSAKTNTKSVSKSPTPGPSMHSKKPLKKPSQQEMILRRQINLECFDDPRDLLFASAGSGDGPGSDKYRTMYSLHALRNLQPKTSK